MTKRITYLLQDGLVPPPGRILALTFTNAAAREMIDRVRSCIDPVERVDITTFHSFAYQVLRAYGNLLGIDRKFSVLSERKSDELIERAFQETHSSWNELDGDTKRDLFQALGVWKQEHVLKLNERYTSPLDDLFAAVLRWLRNRMEQEAILDYDHVLWYTRRLFQEKPSVLHLFQSTYRYILVDEFQDTNPLQFAILQFLFENTDGDQNAHTPVLILADPKQAIYEFQGAVPANVGHAMDILECTEPILLQQNYRTQSAFIRVLSTALREPETVDFDERLGKISLHIAPDPIAEAEWVVSCVQRLIDSGVPYDEVAVLARTNWRLNRVRDLLEERGIPSVFVPDFRAREVENSYSALFERLEQITKERSKRIASLKQAFERLCVQLGLDLEQDDILRTMYEVATTYDSVEYSGQPLWEKVQSFLNEILLEINWGQVIRRAVRGKVFVSSIHGVKGLEFEAILICGVENFCFPSRFVCWPCTNQGQESVAQQLDQEYRVLYVGITRAISEIHLYAALVGGRDMNRQRRVSCLARRIARFITLDEPHTERNLDEFLCQR
jgi:DNA helicase-2/ATP-dependent DNA helicase PcrA